MADSVVTNIAKGKMVKIRAGMITSFPKIVGMVFGDGAASGSSIRAPLATDIGLQNELTRQVVDSGGVVLQLNGISVQYTVTLAKDTLAGKNINEIALYDADNDLVAIKSFSSKGKDSDMEMLFQITDTF